MKKNIHNLDTLEKEIYRLQVEAMKMEHQFDRSFEHLRGNYGSMFVNSFFRRTRKSEGEQSGIFSAFFSNDKFKSAFSRITDRLADKAADGIETLLEKLFRKKE